MVERERFTTMSYYVYDSMCSGIVIIDFVVIDYGRRPGLPTAINRKHNNNRTRYVAIALIIHHSPYITAT